MMIAMKKQKYCLKLKNTLFHAIVRLLFKYSNTFSKTENDSIEQFYDQSEGMEILDTLGKVYGNEPHIAGLSLETAAA